MTPGWRAPLLLCLLLAGGAGCATVAPPPEAAPAPAPASAPVTGLPSDLASRVNALETEITLINRLREIEGTVSRRQAAALEKERDAAVAEVVRTRARMQGMASPAEANAMYAEARVLVDRMEEDAFSTVARDQLRTAKRRLEEGKVEMAKGNPGGAAYLFDQLSNLYESFRKGTPRTLIVVLPSPDLMSTPSATGKTTSSLRRNDQVEGVARQEGWVQVRDASGARKGWVPWEAVR